MSVPDSLAATEFSQLRRKAWLVPKEQTDRFAVKRCDAISWLRSS
jgi:hypothetical protein